MSLVKAWPSPHDREMLASHLRAAGMSSANAAVWVAAQAYRELQDHAATVLDWAEHFPNAHVARTWYDAAFTIEDAVDWSEEGFTADEAEQLSIRLLDARDDATDVHDQLDRERGWRESGLPVDWILFFVDTDVTDATEGRRLYEAALTNPQVIAGLSNRRWPQQRGKSA
jgi:hypothetical protein